MIVHGIEFALSYTKTVHVLLKSNKRTASAQKNILPRTVPVITMNPQAVKRIVKKDKEKLGR